MAEWVSAVAAVVAVIAASLTITFSYLQAKWNLPLKWTREIISRASQCVDSKTRAHHLCEADPSVDEDSFYQKRYELLCEISSLIDRGAIVFVNNLGFAEGLPPRRAGNGWLWPDPMTSGLRL